MKRHTKRSSRWMVLLTTALAGGTVLGTCNVRLHDAITQGTQQYILNSLLSPCNIAIDGVSICGE